MDCTIKTEAVFVDIVFRAVSDLGSAVFGPGCAGTELLSLHSYANTTEFSLAETFPLSTAPETYQAVPAS